MENLLKGKPIRLVHYFGGALIVVSFLGIFGLGFYGALLLAPIIFFGGVIALIIDKLWTCESFQGEILKLVIVIAVLGGLIYPFVSYQLNGTPMSEICPTCVPVPGQPGMYQSR